jgi:LPXTG-motif cell wall-anchored protein
MTFSSPRALGFGAIALSGITLSTAFASSAMAAGTCGAGATLISGDICQVKFTSGSHTFTPPAGIAKLDALIVGAGGASNVSDSTVAYGGGGGDVKLVALDTTGAVTVAVGTPGVDSSPYSTANDSSVAQSGTTTTAQGGRNANNYGPAGASGSGIAAHYDWCDYGCLTGGAGAGSAGVRDLAHAHLGGEGLVVRDLTGASTSLFATDDSCYGGGGGTSYFYENVGEYHSRVATPVCGGGAGSFTTNQNGSYASYSLPAPTANSGGGGGSATFFYGQDLSRNVRYNQPGAAGVVILRFVPAQTPAPLPDTGMNVGGVLGLGASALIVGAAALILGRRRKNA